MNSINKNGRAREVRASELFKLRSGIFLEKERGREKNTSFSLYPLILKKNLINVLVVMREESYMGKL